MADNSGGNGGLYFIVGALVVVVVVIIVVVMSGGIPFVGGSGGKSVDIHIEVPKAPVIGSGSTTPSK